jgi:hypothetical protein
MLNDISILTLTMCFTILNVIMHSVVLRSVIKTNVLAQNVFKIYSSPIKTFFGGKTMDLISFPLIYVPILFLKFSRP